MGSELTGPLSAVQRAARTDRHVFDVEGQAEETRPIDPERGGLARQMRPIRDLWWLVLAIVVASVTAAVMTTLNTPTTYTGRSSMIVSSNNRSPDQDAVLVQGYVDYFNNGAYQSALLAQAQVGPPVTVTARAAASSPIMLIEATSLAASDAQKAAMIVALKFQQDVNKVREAEKTAEIQSLQGRLDQLLTTGGAGSDGAAAALQERIAQIRADRVNELQELQLDGGVATNSPSMATNVLFGALGGLLIGVLAALACDRLRIGGRGLRGMLSRREK
jgi:uncharacterized protein involved in exopolysaccharide biosynthesis